MACPVLTQLPFSVRDSWFILVNVIKEYEKNLSDILAVEDFLHSQDLFRLQSSPLGGKNASAQEIVTSTLTSTPSLENQSRSFRSMCLE
ncbi:hypothetical protein C0J52_26325 [Blattella germanica]|nr:hypothetical protein C0J52_26325 [Blattella germanica]